MNKILCLMMMALLAGCASAGHKLDESKIDQIKKGVTTREQVLQMVGAPEQITRDGDGGVTFQYVYIHATAKASSFIPVVGAFAGGVNTQNEMLMVAFDNNGVVKDIMSTYGANEVGTGLNAGSTPNLPPASK